MHSCNFQVYASLVANVKNLLSSILTQCESIAFTSDCWTSKNATKSFICFTLHTSNDAFQLVSATLGIVAFSGAHKHDVIAEKFHQICLEFGISLDKQANYITTDNGSNIKKAFDEMEQIQRFHCVVHNIQLCITSAKKASPDMNSLATKASSVVSKFNRSTSLQETLAKMQEDLGMSPVKKLVQDVDTRWDSEYKQMSRIIELQPALKKMDEIMGQELFSQNDYRNMKQVS
jgi:hypothetical protein